MPAALEAGRGSTRRPVRRPEPVAALGQPLSPRGQVDAARDTAPRNSPAMPCGTRQAGKNKATLSALTAAPPSRTPKHPQQGRLRPPPTGQQFGFDRPRPGNSSDSAASDRPPQAVAAVLGPLRPVWRGFATGCDRRGFPGWPHDEESCNL